MTTAPNAHDALDQVMGHQAWAVVRLRDSDAITLLGGPLAHAERIADIQLPDGPPDAGRRFDTLVAMPFRQITERGFEAVDDAAPLMVMQIHDEIEVPLAELTDALPTDEIRFGDVGGFETGDEEYAAMVERIIGEEIGHGEVANMVVGRTYRATIEDWGPTAALSVMRRLLEQEHGAYWTFCIFTGERYLIGASPERHLSVTAGDVRMNPISGTFRVHDPECSDIKQRLVEFLADEKEIFELFMVVDEELKMMCDICDEGGQVLGPFLKPMSHLIHTEYLLAGRTGRDIRDVLQMSMFAATVTGAPVENACRLIARYEPHGRGYYAGALALIGRDGDGHRTADSPIVIRTAEVDLSGRLKVSAGATLVRDSDPRSEVAETHAKAGGILSAFGLVARPSTPAAEVSDLARDEDVLVALNARNHRLARFWLTDQSDAPVVPQFVDRTIAILDGGDDFATMLGHIFGVLGLRSSIIRYEDYTPGVFDDHDFVVIGAGPGDPRDRAHPRIATYEAAIDELLHKQQPFLAIRLGHEVLAQRLGFPIVYKDIVFQGTQDHVSVEGRDEVVGFYNTFVARLDGPLPAGVSAEVDPDTGDIHVVAGSRFRSMQFHPESVLTENGMDILRALLLGALEGPDV